MWRTDTYWSDVAVVTTVPMLGHLGFGRYHSLVGLDASGERVFHP